MLRGPPDGTPLLIVPALFEEMNRTRRLLALVGAALALAGVRSWMPDLPGTGDHEDKLDTATPDRWRAALTALADIAGGGREIDVIAVRGGALIAPVARVRSLCRVAPPTDGANIWRSLLRARVAGAGETGDGATIATLEAASRAGEAVNTMGYRVPAALAEGLRLATLAAPPCRIRTVSTAPGADIDAVLPGPPPWLTSEPDDVAPLAAALAADWLAWSGPATRPPHGP